MHQSNTNDVANVLGETDSENNNQLVHLNTTAQSDSFMLQAEAASSDLCPIIEAVAITLENIIKAVSLGSSREPSDSGDQGFNRHKRIRAEAEADYLKTIAKRQRVYDDAINSKKYRIGDLVGLQIDRVDRTNTTPKILSCKIVTILPPSHERVLYQLCALQGVLSVSYGVQDLLDLSKCDFADLRAVDSASLPQVTFIQACKQYTAAAVAQPAEACQCNGKCATKACPCVAKGVQCCSKCHPKKKNGCSNI